MKRILLQLASNELKFEAVDDHVFKNRKFAVDVDGEARYTGNYAIVDGFQATIHFDKINAQIVSGLARMLNISGNLGTFDEPTHVRFHKGNSKFTYDIQTGEELRPRLVRKAA
jgi:hypothetical protein